MNSPENYVKGEKRQDSEGRKKSVHRHTQVLNVRVWRGQHTVSVGSLSLVEWVAVKGEGLGRLACSPRPQGLCEAAHTCSDMKQTVKALPSYASLMSSDSRGLTTTRGFQTKRLFWFSVKERYRKCFPQFYMCLRVCVFRVLGGLDGSVWINFSQRTCLCEGLWASAFDGSFGSGMLGFTHLICRVCACY